MPEVTETIAASRSENLQDSGRLGQHAGRMNPVTITGLLVAAIRAEGLLQYLEASSVTGILSRVDALSRSGSVALYDVVGESLLRSPVMASTLQMMRELGAPWIFGSDEPAALLPSWRTRVTGPAIVGNELERWPFPAAPPGLAGVPRG